MPPFIVNLIIAIVLNVAVTLIQRAMVQDRAAEQRLAGVRGTTTGGTAPGTIILGSYITAGHRIAPRLTWGDSGKTPNEFLVDVIGLSILPVRGLAGAYVNGEKVTLLTGEAHADFGYPVDEYRDGGVDHLWIKFYDGNQTAADAYLVDKFGGHPDFPWQSDMIGRGVAYCICTARINRELFTGFPAYRFQVDGIDLQDWRDGKDEQENPIVAIRRLMKGLYFGSQWVYGPQSIGDYALPAAAFAAQADKCDALVTLEDDSQEKRYRFGIEVSVDTEPHLVIGELLKACAGRIAEVGGIYKVLVAEPDSPVFAFSDEDIIVTEGQSYEPFPGLEATHNAFTATYPEFDESGGMKEAPPLYDTALEDADDGRRLVVSTEFKAVPHAIQVQRLMLAMQAEARRFRRHSITGRPEWWEYEPLDAVTWTSDRNGYANKVFLITAMEDLDNCLQVVGLQEQDPDDYSWTSDLQQPYTLTPIKPPRPAAQVGTITFSAATVVDNDGVGRRAGIRATLASALADVRGVEIQVRLQGGANVYDRETPYDRTETDPYWRDITAPGILPNVTYEARGRYMPTGKRRVGAWSSWQVVTTHDVRFDFVELATAIREWHRWMGEDFTKAKEELLALTDLVALQDLHNFADKQELRREIASVYQNSRAEYEEAIIVATGPGSSIVLRLEELEAAVEAADFDAVVTALSALTTRVTTAENTLTLVGADVTTINAALSGYLGVNAVASAFSSQDVRITANENGVAAHAQSLQDLFVAMGGNTSSVRVRAVAEAGPSGYSARYGIEAATSAGGWRSASIWLDVPASGSTPTRVAVAADQFVVWAGGTAAAVFDSAGLIVPARIAAGSITADKIAAGSITANKIAAGSITADKIVSNSIASFKSASLDSDLDGAGTACQVNFSAPATGATGQAIAKIKVGGPGDAWAATVTIKLQRQINGGSWTDIPGTQAIRYYDGGGYALDDFFIGFANSFSASSSINFRISYAVSSPPGSGADFWRMAGSHLGVGRFNT